MTDTTPPQPADPRPMPGPPSAAPTPRGPGRPPRSGAVTAITVSAAIIGSLALAATGGTAAIAATGQFGPGDTAAQGLSVDATGVRTLTLDAGGGSVTVRYGDVPQATLHSEGRSNGTWRMHREGDALVVQSPRAVFGWWVGDWFQNGPRTTLTLPEELKGRLDADLTLEAGSLDASGDFSSLTAKVSAGSMTLDGSARKVTAEVDAGSADLRLSDVATAQLSMSAGRLDATIDGAQPDDVELQVSAGAMDVTLPGGRYALTKDVSAGSLDARLSTDAASPHRVQVDLSAGALTLRGGR